MAIAEKLLTEGEAADMSSRSRTNWRSSVSSAEKTCTSKKSSGIVSGFALFLLLMNEDKKEDDEWGLIYIDGKRGLIWGVE